MQERRYKLIHFVERNEFELYNLASHPEETQNLYGQPQFVSLQQDLLSRLEKLRAAVSESKVAENA